MIKQIVTSSISTFLVGAFLSSTAYAQVNADYAAVPPESADSDTPQVMLSMSRDHQYFFKAYNDFTDLDPEDLTDVDVDGNPIIETTYKHSFDYFGYFDPEKCYEYSSGGGEFRPVSMGVGDEGKYCDGQWSGNFLNWVSMTRMDIVRKIFYGGSRSTDTGSKTVLERAHLPLDAHSFAKYYNGDDLAMLTPYDSVRTNGTNGGDGDIIGSIPEGEVFDDLDEGITFCNTTDSSGGSSQNSTQPPIIRVAIGNYQLWNSNERWQCTFNDERNTAQGNFNIAPSAPIDDQTFDIDGTDIVVNSGIDAHVFDPDPGDEFIVRVQVCVDGLIGTERCKQYPNGEPKPIGLLQTYGDDGLIDFGLMTGSYQSNIQGGVLRKNISAFANEVDVNNDGTFIFTNTSESIVRTLDSLRIWGYGYNQGTYRNGDSGGDNCDFQLSEIPNGQCNSWGNPISEIYKETVRYMAGLSPQANFNANDTSFISGLRTETWEDPLTEDNQCSDLSTVLINASVSSYDDNDVAIPGVPGGINGIGAAANNSTTETWTNNVGTLEGLAGNQFFIGQNGTNNNEICDAKEIGNLSEVLGICPEAPTVLGSFAMAGIAYYAHNNDLRDGLEGNQTLNTFAISLATNVPSIQVPRTDGGTTVQILPAYRLFPDSADPGGGALVDFRIVTPHQRIDRTSTRNLFEGKFYVSWEDSEQGGDYDQDMWGLIEYVLDEDRDEITITTTAIAESTGGGQLFGFVTNGTTQDGFHAYSGIEGVNSPPTGVGVAGVPDVPGCDNCRPLRGQGGATGQSGPQSHTFKIATSTVGQLESPLYYAAKYGGFEENRAVDEPATLADAPDELEEWDAANNTTGADGPDGLPDNFFFVINPENLFNSLEASLNRILSEDQAASSAVASFASSNGFGNLIVQGTYQELTRQDQSTGGVTRADLNWTGELFSFFVDRFGVFREDTNQDGVLDEDDTTNYITDRAFVYSVQPDEDPRIQYLRAERNAEGIVFTADGRPDLRPDGDTVSIESLNFLWNGSERLRALSGDSLTEQRPYTTAVPRTDATAQPSRYIFTYIDSDLDGEVDGGEQIDFLDTTINASNFGFLGVGSEAIADSIVNYIRGDEDPSVGFRNRTLVERDGTERVFRLGDLVNSTPLVVAGPQAAYDTRFDDDSYRRFEEQYRDRRNMVYVGGNDGLLHAFNGGFRDFGVTEVEYTEDQTGKTQHPLGAEIWAYAPYNLLPHLQWLTSSFYSHVFYVDGSPQAFDVKIFNDDPVHPGGWGTILVVGMRQGGGDFPINFTTQDGSNETISTMTRSAYLVLDITDPEQPPQVLAEITDPDLNLTTSQPDLFYDCDGNCSLPNTTTDDDFSGSWKLVFGSGPNNIRSFNTNETAKIFTYDLETQIIEIEEVTDGLAGNNPIPDSFVGDVSVADWDNGTLGFRNDDVVYFGTVGRRLDLTTPDPSDLIETGGVYRFFPGEVPLSVSNPTNLMLDTDRPVAQKPLPLSRSNLGADITASWLFFGTGIYLTRDNEETSAQERFYGIYETIDRPAIDLLPFTLFPNGTAGREDSELITYDTIQTNRLVDVSNGVVLNNANGDLGPDVQTGDLDTDIAGQGSVAELETFILSDPQQGWFRNLPQGVVAGDPTGRVIDSVTEIANTLFFVTFTPSTLVGVDICAGGVGASELFAVDQSSGLPGLGALGLDANDDNRNEDSFLVGNGAASAPLIFTSEALGANNGVPILQRGDGSLTPSLGEEQLGETRINNVQKIRAGWREITQ